MLNDVILSGHLERDPETKRFGEAKGEIVTTFTLLFPLHPKRTGLIRVSCHSRLAELAEKFLYQGARVVVSGFLEQYRWEAQEGSTRYELSLVALSLEIVRGDVQDFLADSPEGEVPF
jgi:single-stranded DNA-binding protein